MKVIIYGLILMCMASLAGCGDSGNVAKLTGSGAGAILTSTDGGITWNSQVSGTTAQLNSIAYGALNNGNNWYVAVGSSGTILTSADGKAWIPRSSGTTFNLYGIAFGAISGQDAVVAVGDGGTILTSTDGVAWTTQASSPISNALIGVAFANGQFVAVGYSGIVYTSSSGTVWNSINTQSQGITGPTADLYGVAYGNGRFVTVGTYNTSTSGQEITYNGLTGISLDGITWTNLTYPSNYLSGVTYGDGQFVAVGRGGLILASTDGITWTPQTAAPIAASTSTPYLISVIYAGNKYVAAGNYVGTNPSTGFILTSSDGNTWTMPTLPTTGNLYGISYGNYSTGAVHAYVAVGGQ